MCLPSMASERDGLHHCMWGSVLLELVKVDCISVWAVTGSVAPTTQFGVSV